MSFSPEQIAQMLQEYESDHRTGMNGKAVAQEIFDYTAGYPYLVSRICQLLEQQYSKDGRKDAWTHAGILDVVRSLVSESNSLFNFNNNKTPGVQELHFKDYTIVEAVV